MGQVLKALGIEKINQGASTGTEWLGGTANQLNSVSPVDGSTIASANVPEQDTYEKVIETAAKAFQEWRMMPAPKRVRLYGNWE